MAHSIDCLDKILKAKIKPAEGERVTFADLTLPLKVVAADVISGKMRLFSNEKTPHVAVADAVAASPAIPILFKPIQIQGSFYCDGGLVSNLPAWTFDAERILDDSCIVITTAV